LSVIICVTDRDGDRRIFVEMISTYEQRSFVGIAFSYIVSLQIVL